MTLIGGAATPGDPVSATASPARRALMAATAQGLVRFDAAGQVEPALAERWIVIDDGRSYIFRLREASWPGGGTVTAADVVAVLRRAVAEGSANPLRPFLGSIDEVIEMTPQIVEIRLRRPQTELLTLLAQPELAIFRTRTLDGSGPLRIAERNADSIVLRPAFGETDAADPAASVPTLRLRGERAALAVARFAKGATDLVDAGDLGDWPLVATAGIDPGRIRTDPAHGLLGFGIVQRRGFLSDPAGREAVAMAIDRAAFTGSIVSRWEAVDQLLPARLGLPVDPRAPAWTGVPIAERRAEAARRVAQWRAQGGDAPPLRIAMPRGPGFTLLWAHLRTGLRAVGIDAVRVAAQDADADLRLVDRVAPYDSALWYLETACAPCDPAARTAIDGARAATDGASRIRQLAQADALLAADVAFVPIARPLRWSLVGPAIGGWQANARAVHPLNSLLREPN